MMKKIYSYFIFTAAILCAASCAKVEPYARSGASDEITFSVVSYATKANGCKFDTSRTFGTVAWSDAVESDDKLFMDNEQISFAAGCWKPSITYFWPKLASVDFISYYPYDPAGACPVISRNRITYTDYTVSDVDLMYASKAAGYNGNVDQVHDNVDIREGDDYYYEERGSDSGFSGVPTLFNHALSKLNISVEGTRMYGNELYFDYYFSDVKLVGVQDKGSLDMPASNPDASGIIAWQRPEGNVWTDRSGEISISMPDFSIGYNNSSRVSLLSNKLVLPQTLLDGVQKISAKCEVVIYSYYDSHQSYVGYHESTRFTTNVEIPLKTSNIPAWEMNTNYVYRLIISPWQNDDNQNPIEIQFDPAVVSWDSTEIDSELTEPELRISQNQVFCTYTPSYYSWFINNSPVNMDEYLRQRPYYSPESFGWYASRGIFSPSYDYSGQNYVSNGIFFTYYRPVSELNTDYLFAGGRYITSVTFPKCVNQLGRYVFSCCRELESVTFQSGVTVFGYGEFMFSGLKTLDVPENIKSIPDYLCFGCYNLASVTIHEGVEHMGRELFSRDSLITEITVPSTVKTMSHLSLDGCNLKKLYCKPSVPPTAPDGSEGTFLPLSTAYKHDGFAIYVPKGSLDAYKNADGWNSFSDVLQEYDFDATE